MKTEASSVEEYLATLAQERREALEAVRRVILENLPDGYEEAISWGMITYQVPLAAYPNTYNKQPLMYAALASQKNHMAVYLTGIYMDDDARQKFEDEYRATGKRLDAGKSCVRFRKLENLPLEVIARAIATHSMSDFIARAKRIEASRKKKSPDD
jgi:uncharacterized protein YdhG (YjbR/CyaY superfamily)